MKQFLISRRPEPGNGLEIRGADFHYLSRVRRIREGQVLMCRTAGGERIPCRVASVSSDCLVLVVQEDGPGGLTAPAPALPDPEGARVPVHLVQGVPKGKKFEMILRQATELGAASITPLLCRNSVADPSERWGNKRPHLEGIIREAFQQSGGSVLPVLADPVAPGDWCRGRTGDSRDLVLYLHERELAQTTLHRYLDPRPASVTILVGPEGGFSPDETSLFGREGFKPVWLGSQILRTETAAIVALGMVNLLLHESDAWAAC